VTPVSPALLQKWVAALPVEEKNRFLVRVMEGEEMHVGADLRNRFRSDSKPDEKPGKETGRTVGQLLAEAETRRAKRGH